MMERAISCGVSAPGGAHQTDEPRTTAQRDSEVCKVILVIVAHDDSCRLRVEQRRMVQVVRLDNEHLRGTRETRWNGARRYAVNDRHVPTQSRRYLHDRHYI